MSELFDFSKVEEKSEGGGNQKYIYPGVKHHVTIKNLSEGTSPNGTPFYEIEMYTKEGGPETAKAFRMYLSEKARPYTLSNIKHIATKITTEEKLNAVKSFDDLRDLLKGESLRMMFYGEEYKNSNGEIKEKAVIGIPRFAEAIQEGAEEAPVADEDTKLVFDKENRHHFKRLPAESTDSPDQNTSATAW